jgi:hypothetical protein
MFVIKCVRKRHTYVYVRINNYCVLFRLGKATKHIQHVYISWRILAMGYLSMVGRQPPRVIREWWVIYFDLLYKRY